MRVPKLPALTKLTKRLPPWWWKAALGVAGVGALTLLVGRRAMITIPQLYKQGGDAPWADRDVGFGSLPMKAVGCLETVVTMASNALAGTPFDPGDVLDITREAGAYSGSNMILEAAASSVTLNAPESERIHAGHGAALADLVALMDHALSKGGMAAVNVDAHSPSGDGTHWVLVRGKQGGLYLAADPATGEQITIDPSSMRASSTWNNNPYVVGVAPIYAA